MVEPMKACPFCGSVDVFYRGSPAGVVIPNGWCMDCGARGPTADRPIGRAPDEREDEQALQRWNQRAHPTAEVGDIVELLARLRKTDPFVNDPVSLQPRRRNPDGPEAADLIQSLQSDVERLREQRDEALARLYALDRQQVAKWCDGTLDRSGALLGRIRELARIASLGVG